MMRVLRTINGQFFSSLLFISLALTLAVGQMATMLQADTPNAADAGNEVADEPTQDAAQQPATPTTLSRPADGRTNLPLPSGLTVAVIPIQGDIYGFTFESMQRRVDRAMAQGADVIVFEIDTNGGVLLTALDISKYIKGLSVPTVAWINPKALSAGIMIAAACDEIVMSPASVTGDCAPINLFMMNMGPTERGKMLIPVLVEFRDSARRNNYEYAMFHAMCTLDAELFLIEHTETGEQRLVNQVDFAVMVQGRSLDEADRVDLTTLDEDEFARVAKPSLNIAQNADRGMWQPVLQLPDGTNLPNGRVHDGRTPFTVDQELARHIGLSRGTIGDDAALKRYLNDAGTLFRVNETWSEGLAKFLTLWWVRAILFAIFAVCAYIELQAPGLGVPGAIAAGALLILLGAPFLVGLAEIWHVLLFLVGLVLLIVEIVAFPGFGVLGIAGVVMMVSGLVLSIVPTSGSGPVPMPAAEMMDRLVWSSASIVLGVLGTGVGIYLLGRHIDHMPLFNRLVLADGGPPIAAQTGPDARPSHVSGDETVGSFTLKTGDIGRTATDLRPTGQVNFNGQLVDVITPGVWIEKGERVRITEVAGNHITVEKAD